MKRVMTKQLAPAAAALLAGALIVTEAANAQSLGGFPIREPGASSSSSGSSGAGGKKTGRFRSSSMRTDAVLTKRFPKRLKTSPKAASFTSCTASTMNRLL